MGTRKAYIDNTGKVQLTNSVRMINKDEICLTYLSPKQRTAMLIHIAKKVRDKRNKLWSYRARATYPPKRRVVWLKYGSSRLIIVELVDYQQYRILTLSY